MNEAPGDVAGPTQPMDLYRAGDLDGAVARCLELVKSRPTDTAARFQLAELSCIAGDLERADRQLDTVSTQDPEFAVAAALLRQLVRAEMARRECFFAGRVPEFIGTPSPAIEARLRALASLRSGAVDEAAEIVRRADESVTDVGVQVNGQPVTQLRDLDDLLAPLLEVHTSTGKYFWIDWDQIVSMEVHPPQRPLDLLWRQATLSIAAGPDGEVFLPAIYLEPDGPVASDASLRLGRSTDWVEMAEGFVRGRGQRMLLVGENDLPFLELVSIIGAE